MSLSFPLCTDGHSYRETAKAISAEIRDRERTPTEAAADVIERAHRRKGTFRHRMVSLDLPWYTTVAACLSLTLIVFLSA